MTIRHKKQFAAALIVFLCLLFLVSVSNILHSSSEKSSKKNKDDISVTQENDVYGEKTKIVFRMSSIMNRLKQTLCATVMPVLAFSGEDLLADNAAEAVFIHVGKEYPILYYMGEYQDQDIRTENESLQQMILALEGADEDKHSYFEDIDSSYAMELENQAYRETEAECTAQTDTVQTDSESILTDSASAVNDSNIAGDSIGDSDLMTQVNLENAAAGGRVYSYGESSVTLRNSKTFLYDFTQYEDLDDLVKGFYIVDSSTSVSEERLNLDFLLHTDVTMHGDNSKPQILIYHTHSQEGYADSVPGDVSTGVVGAGEYLAQILREEYGYHVIHHTGQYDVVARDDAYAAAAPEIERILQENPSIEVVIDLHRDEVKEGVHLVTDIDGTSCAKFMFFNGLSYSNTLGDISYLYNPHREENLAFSFRAQVLANEYYPGITRGIYLRAYRYNMHFVGKNMLLELGAQNNTREEVWNSVPIIAQVLDEVLMGE